MRSHEVLRAAAEQVGVKSLASELRLSPALIYKWCEQADSADPDSSGTRNPLDRLRDIVRVTGHIPVVNWLCHEADGFFVHNPETESPNIDADLLQSTQHLVGAFSRLLSEVSRSVADDGAIDPACRCRNPARMSGRLGSRRREFATAPRRSRWYGAKRSD